MKIETSYAIRYTVLITFHKLDRATVKIVGYDNASFWNNLSINSKFGFIIILSDKTDKVISIFFKSYTSKWICRSAMDEKVIASAISSMQPSRLRMKFLYFWDKMSKFYYLQI